jgi:histidine triad (HIT) family protein
MSDCVFCRIAAGTAKADVVHESPGAIAFLDRSPSARGHVMVIPRTHAATLLELEADAVGELFRAVQAVMRKLNDALHPTAFHVGWNHGRAAGQHVFHLHVHVLPRFREGGRGIQMLGEGPGRESLAELAEAIRNA